MTPADTDPADQADPSRRLLVGGLSAGLVAAFAGSASAQETQTVSSGPEAPPAKRNPVTQYPQPPFKPQSQEWPGLAARMDPPPDHGENTYKGSGRLRDRKALITGGDSGMGRAAAIAYAREGADVAINYLPQEEEDARAVVALIEAAGRKAVALPGDLTDEAFCARLVDDAARELGGLDVLVSNAAFQRPHKALADITTENFDRTFRTNVYAMFWLTKAALRHMTPGSAIIVTSSVQGYNPSEQLVDYAMTKSCNVSFTKSMAKQLAPMGIRVNSVAPGPIWTPLQPAGGQFPEDLPSFGADTPMKRPGQPGELASLYVALASPESSYSTGQVFGAVGGNGGP